MSENIRERLHAIRIVPPEELVQLEEFRDRWGRPVLSPDYRLRQAEEVIDKLVTALEEEHDLRLRVKAEADRVCSLEQGAAECAEKRAERAEAERNALQHIIDCADTPLMRDVMAARDQAKAKLTRSETAFGILSDSHPDEAQEAWRKAGELCGEATWPDALPPYDEQQDRIEEAEAVIAAMMPMLNYRKRGGPRPIWRKATIQLAWYESRFGPVGKEKP